VKGRKAVVERETMVMGNGVGRMNEYKCMCVPGGGYGRSFVLHRRWQCKSIFNGMFI